MLETILGSVLGFGTSLFPTILEYFQDSKDKKHELLAMDKQLALLGKQAELNVQEARVTGEMEALRLELLSEVESVRATVKPMTLTGITWVDALRGSVRPVVTYWFMGLYTYSKVSIYVKGGTMWTTQDWAIFATIISFWFGDRIRKYLQEKR